MAKIAPSTINRLTYAILLSILSSYNKKVCGAALDSMIIGQQLNVSDTIISAEGFYELGFFSPQNSTNLYLGIWFRRALTRAIVWVSNQAQPLTTSSPILLFRKDGNLVILEGHNSIMVTNVSSYSSNTRVVMMDSGNLVMQEKNLKVLWQSFDHPTDTILGGMKYGYDKETGKIWSLRSWANARDPSPGAFHMMLDPNGSSWSFISRGPQIYGTYWVTHKPNSTWSMSIKSTRIYFSYKMPKKNMAYLVFNFSDKNFCTRYVLDVSGQLKVYVWFKGSPDWIPLWSVPNKQCDFYGYCGNFAICNQQSSNNICSCLPGYQPTSLGSWKNDNYGVGCRRKTPLGCTDRDKHRFVIVPKVTLPVHSLFIFGIHNIEDCNSICVNNCSCLGYSYMDNQCSIFTENVINVQQLLDNDVSARDLYIKISTSDLTVKDHSSHEQRLTEWTLWMIAVASLCLIVTAFVLFIYELWKDKATQEEGEDLLSFDFSSTPREVITTKKPRNYTEEDYQIPLFHFSSVCAAANDFSTANKLGKGGFGAIYKGKLLDGDEIAIKRLSKLPKKRLKELKKEAIHIAELQHNNLVKLLGCCFEGNENILIYEYFPNKSLDYFLFDPVMYGILNWGTRTQIINGIALGLNYLHQHSRSQIIHGDLKASNILLDEDMNPKISDFVITRIFGAKETLATNRMFGTFGYMSPEYASEGIVSNKSDVFSFGILLLEILSGKKNNFRNGSSLNLLTYAWDLWKCNRPLDLVDPIMGDTATSNMMRYIEIALLCLQENANDRPTMSDVVAFLENDVMSFPTPREPTFSRTKTILHDCSCMINRNLVNESTNLIRKSQ